MNMLTAAMCFASMGACVHWLGGYMHFSVVTFFRMFISLALLLVFARPRGIPIVIFGSRALWVRSGVGSIGMICNFYGMTMLPISDALAMLHTAPIWVALIRRAIYKDTLDAVDWLCILGAVGGVFLAEGATFDVEPFGVTVALFGAFFAGCAFVSMGFLGSMRPESVTMHFAGFGSLVALGFFLASLPGSTGGLPPTALHGGGLVLTAIFGTFAQIFMTMGLARGHTVTMTLIGLTQVVFAGVYDWLFWDQTFTATKLLGFGIMGGCVALMSIRRTTRPV